MAEQNKPSTNAFSEYVRFEPMDEAGKADREQEYARFIAGQVTSPAMVYPKLDDFERQPYIDAYDEAIRTEEDVAREALLIARRKGVEIADASRRHNLAGKTNDHAERYHSGLDIVATAESRYGVLDPVLFSSVLAQKLDVVRSFSPTNLHAEMLRDRLLGYMPAAVGEVGPDVIGEALIEKISPSVLAHLAPILGVIPEEGQFAPSEIKTIAETVLDSTGLSVDGWKVVVVETASLFSVARSSKTLKIPGAKNPDGSTKTWQAKDLRRLMSHEVGSHAMSSGLMDQDMEEGLGLLFETVVTGLEGNASIKRAVDRYFAVGLAAGLDGVGRNARQVFEILWRTEAISMAKDGIVPVEVEETAKQKAKTLIENIFRGTDHKLPGVYYNKAKLYLEGIINMAGYAAEHYQEEDWINNLLQKGNS